MLLVLVEEAQGLAKPRSVGSSEIAAGVRLEECLGEVEGLMFS